MGRAQSDTYSSLFNESDNVNVDETFFENLCLCTFLSVVTRYDSISFIRHNSNIFDIAVTIAMGR